MISSDGQHKQFLKQGEVKCLQSDRVVLDPMAIGGKLPQEEDAQPVGWRFPADVRFGVPDAARRRSRRELKKITAEQLATQWLREKLREADNQR